jgi:hypothetical protein
MVQMILLGLFYLLLLYVLYAPISEKNKNNDFEQQVIKEYYNDSRALSLKNERIEIVGQMGTDHTPTARVIIRPTIRDDLPDSIIREFPQSASY